MYDITLQDLPARRLVGVPHRGDYQRISTAFEKLGAILGARALWPQVELMVGVYYDDPSAVAPEALRSFAGAAVSAEVGTEPPLQEVPLPAGRHAVLRFTGPYAELPTAYDDLYGRWLPQSGETQTGAPTYELYLNSPADTAPANLVTDICMPLRSV